MNLFDYFTRIERLHTFQNPTSVEKLDHPDRAEFMRRSASYKHDHISYDRHALAWALFVVRVES